MKTLNLPTVAVIGGGVAGIAAALAAADRGARVRLFESLPLLGGRVAGRDAQDTGRHLALSCYDSFLALLDRLGSRDSIRLAPLHYSTLLPDGSTAHLPFHHRRVPGPLPAGAGLLLGQFLPARDRLAAARALGRTLRAGIHEPSDEQLAGDGQTHRFKRAGSISLADMFDHTDWPDSLRQRLGIPLAISISNLPPEQQAAGPFLLALKRVLADPHPRAGWVNGDDYGAVISAPAHTALTRAGVEVRLGEGIQEVRRVAGAASTDGWELVGDQIWQADRVVVTVPPARLTLLAKVAETAPLLRWAEQQTGNGILTLRAQPRNLAPFPGPRAEATPPYAVWFAEAHPTGGVQLERVISGLRNDAVANIIPWTVEFRSLAQEWFGVAIREREISARWYPDATMSLVPGVLRPALRQGPGLFYATDLSATGLPATLESAARAGELAGRLATGDASAPDPAGSCR